MWILFRKSEKNFTVNNGNNIDTSVFYVFIEREWSYRKVHGWSRERSPIPQERRVVTASWKRLGVVSGLRRTSTLPVVGTFFLRLRCACVSRCCGPRHRMFPYRTRKASGTRRKHRQITQIPRKPVGLVRHVNHKRRLTLAAILVPFVLCDSYLIAWVGWKVWRLMIMPEKQVNSVISSKVVKTEIISSYIWLQFTFSAKVIHKTRCAMLFMRI